jgi:hypothetical protein
MKKDKKLTLFFLFLRNSFIKIRRSSTLRAPAPALVGSSASRPGSPGEWRKK